MNRLTTAVLAAAMGTAVAAPPHTVSVATAHDEVSRQLNALAQTGYRESFGTGAGQVPLAASPVNDHLFAIRGDEAEFGLGFSEAPAATSTLAELRRTFAHIALDRIPVPGVQATGWETRLRTPTSTITEGVTIVSWENGIIRLRVQTEFFAAYGQRADVQVPADAALPEDAHFQIRRRLAADFEIRARLFSGASPQRNPPEPPG